MKPLDPVMRISKKVYFYILTVGSIQRYLRCHDCLIIAVKVEHNCEKVGPKVWIAFHRGKGPNNNKCVHFSIKRYAFELNWSVSISGRVYYWIPLFNCYYYYHYYYYYWNMRDPLCRSPSGYFEREMIKYHCFIIYAIMLLFGWKICPLEHG